MNSSILRAVVAARAVVISYRKCFEQSGSLPYININSNSNPKDQRILSHFENMHQNTIVLEYFKKEHLILGNFDRPFDTYGNSPINAYCENYSNHQNSSFPSKVYVYEPLSEGERRFHAVKELIHLVTATTGNITNSTDDIEALLDGLVNAQLNGESRSEALQAEHAAYFGAIEVLLNMEVVDNFLTTHQSVDLEAAADALADQYVIPRKVASFRIRRREIFSEIYQTDEYRSYK